MTTFRKYDQNILNFAHYVYSNRNLLYVLTDHFFKKGWWIFFSFCRNFPFLQKLIIYLFDTWITEHQLGIMNITWKKKKPSFWQAWSNVIYVKNTHVQNDFLTD